ncbi:hypothetical protein KUCAC02_002509, partial [Chaenocephalus aceratus]
MPDPPMFPSFSSEKQALWCLCEHRAKHKDLQTTLESLFQSIEPAGQTTNSHITLATAPLLNRVHLENTEASVLAEEREEWRGFPLSLMNTVSFEMSAALFKRPMTVSSCHNSDFLYKHNLIKTATLVCGRASWSSPPIKSRQEAKMRRVRRGKDARERSQKNVTLKATPCLNCTASQQGLSDPVTGHCRGQHTASCAHCHSCQSASMRSSQGEDVFDSSDSLTMITLSLGVQLKVRGEPRI